MMGSENGQSNEEPVHEVCVDGFWMGKYEVTRKQWRDIMGTEPWKGESYVKEGDNYPAVYVSWDDAKEFSEKFSQKYKVKVRLPTEAQWEYAARAGTKAKYSFGDDESVLGDYAWYRKNAWDIGEKYAHQVGQKKPNPWGLYDMHGNVWEWSMDWYGENYYGSSPERNPRGPGSGEYRVLRGGSFYGNARYLRSADRGWCGPDGRDGNDGFRLLLLSPE